MGSRSDEKWWSGRVSRILFRSASPAESRWHRSGGDHSSRPAVARRLEHPTRSFQNSISRTPSSSRRAASRCLFGLAGGGVCPATVVTNRAVRSYRTISPLPVNLRPRRRYVFCGTVPRVAPGWRCQPPCPIQFGLSSRTSRPASWLCHEQAGSASRLRACTVPAIAFAHSTGDIVEWRLEIVDLPANLTMANAETPSLRQASPHIS